MPKPALSALNTIPPSGAGYQGYGDAVRAKSTVAERAAGGARQWMAMIEREPEALLLFMEFWAYGVRDAGVRPKVAARFAQVRRLFSTPRPVI